MLLDSGAILPYVELHATRNEHVDVVMLLEDCHTVWAVARQLVPGSEDTVEEAIDLHGGVLDEGEVGHSQEEATTGAEEAWTVVAFVSERLSVEREIEIVKRRNCEHIAQRNSTNNA